MTERVVTFELDGPPGERLDRALSAMLGDLSRTQVQRLIGAGLVALDGEILTRPAHRVNGGEQVIVRVPPPPPSEAAPEDIPLNILFENADLIVLNKPAGMVIHPSAGHSGGTLVNALLAHAPAIRDVGAGLGARPVEGAASRPEEGSPPRPGIVHRLDKDTSGLIVVAKNDPTLRALQKQFKERDVEKVYLALVGGAPPTPAGLVEAPVGRDPRQRKRMAVVPISRGREAVTEFRTIERFDEHTLIEARPRTGRTHQIRVHMAYLGCPIAGDTVYGRRKNTVPGLTRQFLHASRLTFQLPGKTGRQSFVAPLPEDLQQALDELRRR